MALLFVATAARSQSVTATWEYSNLETLSACALSGDDSAEDLVSVAYELGANLTATRNVTSTNAADGYESVDYTPYFTAVMPNATVSTATTGHTLSFSVTPTSGHKFKPTKVAFDAGKIGTDAGGVNVVVTDGSTTTTLGSITPLRNKIMEGNSTGYTHSDFYVNDYNVEDGTFTLVLYVMNVTADSKEMGFRNIVIEGEMDSDFAYADTYLADLTFSATVGKGEQQTYSLLELITGMSNGDNAVYGTKLSSEPSDFTTKLTDEYTEAGYTASVTYDDHVATIVISNGNNQEVFTFSVTFSISTNVQKGDAVALGRGLMALHRNGGGNLVSWRAFKDDDKDLSFLLYSGSSAEAATTPLNSGNIIAGKTNFLDTAGSESDYYRLETLDADGNVIETTTCSTWSNQTLYIPLTEGAPTDESGLGATYTPNDAAICDMDGDGEYEIILKWYPSNAKDAASSGSTSNIFFDCYKLDGTRLWRIDMGQNFFASAHTVQFIAWDLDGDGYGEFMAKTAPGTVDGQGNYVVMGDDDPTANWKNSNGKQVEGPEYITVFDGLTGAEISTIAYHTTYADGDGIWGDIYQNRSERYLAAIAWLDGEDYNPSPIFARGYYTCAFVAAYDFDGEQLTERWVSRNTTKGSGLWGEGAHWISVADCDGDGNQEIVYGSAALDDDGSLLYRTGLGHGDALHVGDFDPDHDGLEVFMAHEESPYGADLRDAATGEIYWHPTASSDTGRGLAAFYNPEVDGAYLQHSASSSLYDWNGDVIVSSVTHGGGASLNYRVFWNGLLSDDYFDKTILEAYNPTTKTFDRMKVNGTNYTVGTLNNDTKRNPCIAADILGDWREEIMTWTQDDDGVYYLIINATDYSSDYTVPHLMEDVDYRAQVISQNVCYNQPAHLGYSLRNDKKVTRTLTEAPNTTGDMKYWDCFYTTYPVIIPSNVAAWKVTGYTANDVDTVVTARLEAGVIIPANSGIVYCSADETATFEPSSLTTDDMESTIIEGSYIHTKLPSATNDTKYYEFRVGDRGPGFYEAGGTTVEGRNGYICLTSTTGDTLADSYIIGEEATSSSTSIENIEVDYESNPVIYNLQGQRVSTVMRGGIYIINGKKVVVK